MSRWSKLAAGAGDFTRGFAQGLDGPGIGKIITEKRRRDEERGRYETGLQRENAKLLASQLAGGTTQPDPEQEQLLNVLDPTFTGALRKNISETDRERRQAIKDEFDGYLSTLKTLVNTDPRKSWTLDHRNKANSTLTSLANLEREALGRYPDMKLDRGPTGLDQFKTFEEVFENHRRINTATTHNLQMRDLLLEQGGGLADELEALGYLHAANPDLMTDAMYAGRQESIKLQYIEKDFELALSKNLNDEALQIARKSGNPALIRKAELFAASATKNNDITKIQQAIQHKMWDLAFQVIEDSEDPFVQGMRASVVEYSEQHFKAADQLFYGRVEALADKLEAKHISDQKMVGGPLYFEGYQEGGTSVEIISRGHWLTEARKLLVAGRGGAFASIGAQRASLRDPAPAGASIAQTFIAKFEEMVEDHQEDPEAVRAQAEAMMFHMSNSRMMSLNEKEMIRSYFREMELLPEGAELFPDSPESLAHTIRTPLAKKFMKDMVAGATDVVNQAYLEGGEEGRQVALSDAMGAFVDASKVGLGTLVNPNDVLKMYHLVEDATSKERRAVERLLLDDTIEGVDVLPTGAEPPPLPPPVPTEEGGVWSDPQSDVPRLQQRVGPQIYQGAESVVRGIGEQLAKRDSVLAEQGALRGRGIMGVRGRASSNNATNKAVRGGR